MPVAQNVWQQTRSDSAAAMVLLFIISRALFLRRALSVSQSAGSEVPPRLLIRSLQIEIRSTMFLVTFFLRRS
jgi:hypothetical protein